MKYTGFYHFVTINPHENNRITSTWVHTYSEAEKSIIDCGEDSRKKINPMLMTCIYKIILNRERVLRFVSKEKLSSKQIKELIRKQRDEDLKELDITDALIKSTNSLRTSNERGRWDISSVCKETHERNIEESSKKSI